MAEAENLVLEHLRHMRGQLDRAEDDIGEIKGRAASKRVSRKSMSRSPSNRSASIVLTRESLASRNGSTWSRARHQSPVQRLKGSNLCH
ncbi:MAG: hypothetical protein ACREDM_14385 [Methylocella sp.]